MFDPTIGRWLEEDPEGFQAGDQNLYRYVGNDPTNATDPSGLQVADINFKTVKVGNKSALQGGGQVVDAQRAVLGIVSLELGVTLTHNAIVDGNPAVASPSPGVRITFAPAAGQNAADFDLVQFGWIEFKQTTPAMGEEKEKVANIGIPAHGGHAANIISTSTGLWPISLEPKTPVWSPDAKGNKTISYVGAGGIGTRKGGPDIFDNPNASGLAMLSLIEAIKAALLAGKNGSIPIGTKYTALMHFTTYLVFKKKPVYQVSWTAQSTATVTHNLGLQVAMNKTFTETQYTLDGSGPVAGLLQDQSKAIKAQQDIVP